MDRKHATVILAGSVAIFSMGPTRRAAAQDTPQLPAEEVRLDTKEFLDGLERRGLHELIELHLRDFPSNGSADDLLRRRRLRLADYSNTGLSAEQRRRAIAEADDILERLIEQNPGDQRRFAWLFELAHSLVYNEGEPFFTSILYRGGNARERAALRALTERAVSAVNRLAAELEEEYDKVDKLPIDRFSELEGSGYIDEIDQLGPRSQYLRIWTLFYDCLWREEEDPQRVQQLHEIRESLDANASLWDSPHETSRVQIPALVLAGMVERRLNDHGAARSFFDRATAAADRLTDREIRNEADWAVFLASIERIRNEADDGEFGAAISSAESLRKQLETAGTDEFGRRVVVAILERSIQRNRAAAAKRGGQSADAVRFRAQSWQPLIRLLNQEPTRRDEVYATLYGVIEPEADPAQLDPIDQCALIAGVLSEVQQADPETKRPLERAVAAGEAFLANLPPEVQVLRPEVLFNLAVIQYRRGLTADAAQRFLDLARERPKSGHALQSAIWAVQIASQLDQDPDWSGRPEVRQLYLNALDHLVTHFPDTDAAHYWRFYFAQLLEEEGDFDRAADQFALVDSTHEHYLESLFRHIRCTARGLLSRAKDGPSDEVAFRRQVDEFMTAQRSYAADALGTLARDVSGAKKMELQQAAARSKLLAAEIQVLPSVGRYTQALETLSELEQKFPHGPVAVGRVWRVRLLAFEALGQFDQAAQAIPSYVAADPTNAGPTLQQLYADVVADYRKLIAEEDTRSAGRKAEIALVLARQLVQWDHQRGGASDPAKRRAFQVQLAEANLYAGHCERALELFESLRPEGSGTALSNEPGESRVLSGLAESMFQLGQFENALQRFNALAVHLPANDPIRWQALLRDLQCRTSLGHSPEGILKVISQQRYLYPQLGGPTMAAQFDKLQRENQRRLDESKHG